MDSKENKEDNISRKKRIFKRILQIIGRFFMGLVFTVVFLGGIIGFIYIYNEFSIQGVYFDLFGYDLPISTILLIVSPLIFLVGGYGFYQSIKILIAALKRKHLTKIPRTTKIDFLVLILGLGILGAYYLPMLPVEIGVYKPTFGPYIAIHDENTMLVSWDSTRLTNSIVYWGVDEKNLENKAIGGKNYWEPSETLQSLHHAVRIEGLQPDTDYYYKVPSLGNEVYKFHTPPLPNSNKSITFTIVGDTQGGYQIQKKNIGWMLKDKYKPDFTIIAGDLVNRDDSLSEWSMVFDKQSYGKLASTIPWMNAPGNHEFSCSHANCGFRESYRKYFQYNYPGNRVKLDGAADYGMYYSFNYSNVHMVILDNFENQTYTDLVGETVGTYFTQQQLNWLESDLSRNKNNWKFIVFHVPMYSDGDFGSNEILAKQLEPILEKYEVDAVFYGHDHHFESFLVNATSSYGGIYHFIVGGGGGSIDAMQSKERYGDRAWPGISINRTEDPTKFDSIFGNFYGSEYELYGELTHHYMQVHVSGDTATFTAYRTSDHSIIVQYVVQR